MRYGGVAGIAACSTVPAPADGLDVERAADEREPLAHPEQPEAARRAAAGRSRGRRRARSPRSSPSRSLTETSTRAGAARAWRCWSAPPARAGRSSTRSRRRGGRSVAVLVGEVDLERRPRGRSGAMKRATSASSAGLAPSSSSAAGRSSVISERRSPIAVVICSSAPSIALADALRVAAAARAGEQHPQPGELLQRLVVQLARPARALGLGGLDPAPQRLLARVLGGRHGGRGARRERLQQPLVLLVERAVVARSGRRRSGSRRAGCGTTSA